jgi:hypothetical protein
MIAAIRILLVSGLAGPSTSTTTTFIDMYNLLKADLSHLVLAPPEQIGGKARKAVSELLHPTIPSLTCAGAIDNPRLQQHLPVL